MLVGVTRRRKEIEGDVSSTVRSRNIEAFGKPHSSIEGQTSETAPLLTAGGVHAGRIQRAGWERRATTL